MEIPRKYNLQTCVPAELAIFKAMQEVEKVGADVKLTQAIQKLSEAKDLVSDYVDNNNKMIIYNFICRKCGYSCSVPDTDKVMINFIKASTTHGYANSTSRCSHELEEVSEKEFLEFQQL